MKSLRVFIQCFVLLQVARKQQCNSAHRIARAKDLSTSALHRIHAGAQYKTAAIISFLDAVFYDLVIMSRVWTKRERCNKKSNSLERKPSDSQL